MFAAFSSEGFQCFCNDVRFDNIVGGFLNIYLTALGTRLDALSQVDRITDGNVVEQLAGAHTPNNDRIIRNAHTDEKLVLGIGETLMSIE